MFPDRQQGPHRDWKYEVEFLDNIFQDGAAYTVGKMNGDHWLLYMTSPTDSSETIPKSPKDSLPDYTIEILMSDLSQTAREPFSSTILSPSETPASRAHYVSLSSGIVDIFPPSLTSLDAYSFSPCGYSSNALIRWGEDPDVILTSEGYYTIHVTPEEGWSYASFECNVPLSPSGAAMIPDLKTLIRRVVSIFQPGRLSLTLFISSQEGAGAGEEAAVEAAQKAFKAALVDDPPCVTNGLVPRGGYKRTDKINYEFGGYDLAFASFELIS